MKLNQLSQAQLKSMAYIYERRVLDLEKFVKWPALTESWRRDLEELKTRLKDKP